MFVDLFLGFIDYLRVFFVHIIPLISLLISRVFDLDLVPGLISDFHLLSDHYLVSVLFNLITALLLIVTVSIYAAIFMSSIVLTISLV